MKTDAIGIVADKGPKAQEALKKLMAKYKLKLLRGLRDTEGLDVIVALGGDGFMLHMLHEYIDTGLPIYGMNRGTVGFLMNEYRETGLLKRLKEAHVTTVDPLIMEVKTQDGEKHAVLAINEVSLLRSTRQAAKIRISIDNVVKIEEMVCDGVLVSTAAGSSAYNFSSGGPIIPLKAHLVALTPISPFRPRRWRGALLQDKVSIKFEIRYPHKRPVNAVADFTEIKDVAVVKVKKDPSRQINFLFDPDHSLEERILREQFNY